MLHNKLTELLKIEYPIIQAPMAGGITTSSLVASVSNNGGLGMIGAGYMTPNQIREQVREIRRLTSNVFGINLFVPQKFSVTEEEIEAANQKLQPIREKLNLQQDNTVMPDATIGFEVFNEQIRIVLEEKIPVCSFTFGVPSEEVVAKLKQEDIILVGTATTVKEAIEIERVGMDAVVVQGSEAGGHRGNFKNRTEEGLVGLMSLIPQVADNVRIPIIAAGGIMDGRGLMASIFLGAKGVQMGTAFLMCEESGAHKQYKETVLHSGEDETILTRTFSGKWARGINNTFISEMKEHELIFPTYPVQNTLTQPIRKAAAAQNNPNFMSLWSGQSPRLAKRQTVETLINNVISESKRLGRGGLF